MTGPTAHERTYIRILIAHYRKTDKGRHCFYCGIRITHVKKQTQPAAPSDYTRDHVYPRSKGGGDRHNKVTCCLRCNSRKRNLTYEQFRKLMGGGKFFNELGWDCPNPPKSIREDEALIEIDWDKVNERSLGGEKWRKDIYHPPHKVKRKKVKEWKKLGGKVDGKRI